MLRKSLLLTGLAVWWCLAPLASAHAERNVLLIIADDFGVDMAKWYPTSAGRFTTSPLAPHVKNLEALAKVGAIIPDFYALPECSPTRATIYTGRLPFRHGVGHYISQPDGYPELREGEFTLPMAFTAALGADGVYLQNVGKYNIHYDPPSIYTRGGWPNHNGVGPSTGGMPNYFDWTRIKVTNGVSQRTTHVTTYATTDQVNVAIGAIATAKSQAKPYFMILGLSAPHSTYMCPPTALMQKAHGCANDRDRYEAMIEAIDTELGRLLKVVDLATTTVIFVGDNGTPGAVQASPYKGQGGKSTAWENGSRVPVLFAGAGVIPTGTGVVRVIQELGTVADLFPTILGFAGINAADVVPPGTILDGIDLSPLFRDEAIPNPHESVYYERFNFVPQTFGFRAIKNVERYKLIVLPTGEEKLYHLPTDPWENKNLLLAANRTPEGDANYASLRAQMVALLASGGITMH